MFEQFRGAGPVTGQYTKSAPTGRCDAYLIEHCAHIRYMVVGTARDSLQLPNMMLVLLAGSLLLAARLQAVSPPSQDSFYTQTSNISSYAPGAIFNAKSILTNIHSPLPRDPNITVDATYQYLYRTIDSQRGCSNGTGT